ncbi:MAG TPA: GspH/FimT family pseudopilin [Candidatus Polarisedimenticolia bacterium]|nr:GspH/FimT family pseudopilin [Candidatus Polarisedimenticolia bacterium]
MDRRRTGPDQTGRGQRGYSLPELLIVIAIMALFILFAGPAMAEAYKAYKVRAVANGLATDIRAQRYNAVSNRQPRTLTVNNQAHATAPNQYSYATYKGDTITVRMDGVNVETASAASITFNINGSTGSAGNTTFRVSAMINSSRNDRYTITVTPTGTVSTAYSTF